MRPWLLMAICIVALLSAGALIWWDAGTDISLAAKPTQTGDGFSGTTFQAFYDITPLTAPSEAKEGDTVYVSIALTQSGWQAQDVSMSKPQGMFMRGKVRTLSQGKMLVSYGIETLTFPKESSFDTRGLILEAKVRPDGAVWAKRLIAGDQRISIASAR